jgi:RND family efflux transporter MFP subunit
LSVPVLALVLATPFFAGCGQKSAADPAASGPMAMPVQVLVAQEHTVPRTTEYLSAMKSRHSANINPQVEGFITRIFVKSGDRVRAGAPLLQIDPLKQEAAVSSQEAAHASQQANVALAKVTLDRQKKLFDAGVVSKQELDNAQSTYDAAVAQLKSLEDQVRQQQVQLQYYRVTAPMNGIVGDIPVRVGDRVTVSTLLTTVDEPGALEAYIYVPTDHSAALKTGLPVRLLDSAGKVLDKTQITFVSPQVDTDTQTVLAKAAVSNSNAKLRIAQQVRAEITWGIYQAPLIPILDVVRINGQNFAFVAANEGKGPVARLRRLNIEDTVGNDYVVNDGIHPGDHVITSGLQFLQDGAPVKEIEAAPAAGSGGGPAT